MTIGGEEYENVKMFVYISDRLIFTNISEKEDRRFEEEYFLGGGNRGEIAKNYSSSNLAGIYSSHIECM